MSTANQCTSGQTPLTNKGTADLYRRCTPLNSAPQGPNKASEGTHSTVGTTPTGGGGYGSTNVVPTVDSYGRPPPLTESSQACMGHRMDECGGMKQNTTKAIGRGFIVPEPTESVSTLVQLRFENCEKSRPMISTGRRANWISNQTAGRIGRNRIAFNQNFPEQKRRGCPYAQWHSAVKRGRTIYRRMTTDTNRPRATRTFSAASPTAAASTIKRPTWRKAVYKKYRVRQKKYPRLSDVRTPSRIGRLLSNFNTMFYD